VVWVCVVWPVGECVTDGDDERRRENMDVRFVGETSGSTTGSCLRPKRGIVDYSEVTRRLEMKVWDLELVDIVLDDLNVEMNSWCCAAVYMRSGWGPGDAGKQESRI